MFVVFMYGTTVVSGGRVQPAWCGAFVCFILYFFLGVMFRSRLDNKSHCLIYRPKFLWFIDFCEAMNLSGGALRNQSQHSVLLLVEQALEWACCCITRFIWNILHGRPKPNNIQCAQYLFPFKTIRTLFQFILLCVNICVNLNGKNIFSYVTLNGCVYVCVVGSVAVCQL